MVQEAGYFSNNNIPHWSRIAPEVLTSPHFCPDPLVDWNTQLSRKCPKAERHRKCFSLKGNWPWVTSRVAWGNIDRKIRMSAMHMQVSSESKTHYCPDVILPLAQLSLIGTSNYIEFLDPPFCTSHNPVSLPQGFIFICPAWLTHFFSKYLWSLLFASGPGLGTQWWLKQCCPQEFCSQVCRRDMRRPTVWGRLQWKWVKKEATVNTCQNPLTNTLKMGE